MWCPLIPRRAPPWRPGCWPGTTWGPCRCAGLGAAPGDGDGPGHRAAVRGGGGGPRSVPVRSIMSRRPAVVTPEDDVRQAARLMSSQQVRRLPVVDKDRVVGVVSLGTWPSAAAMRWRFPGPLPTSPRTSVSPEPGPRGKQQSLPRPRFPYACSTRVRILQAWSQASWRAPRTTAGGRGPWWSPCR